MEKVYNKGQKPKTWADVKTFDDCVIKGEKRFFQNLKRELKKKKFSYALSLEKKANLFIIAKKIMFQEMEIKSLLR